MRKAVDKARAAVGLVMEPSHPPVFPQPLVRRYAARHVARLRQKIYKLTRVPHQEETPSFRAVQAGQGGRYGK